MHVRTDHDRRLATPGIATAIISALLAAAFLATSWIASAQDQSAATPQDAIFARKILMDGVDARLNTIEMASRKGGADFTNLTMELRVACEACHALYLEACHTLYLKVQ